jgi:hypothetical protein
MPFQILTKEFLNLWSYVQKDGSPCANAPHHDNIHVGIVAEHSQLQWKLLINFMILLLYLRDGAGMMARRQTSSVASHLSHSHSASSQQYQKLNCQISMR